MTYELTEQKKVGLGLLGFGILFTFLGVVLFFDRGLLALGNIFWLTGVALLLGWRSTLNVFTNNANIKGSASFGLGLFFLFVRWPILGIVLELYGCLVLFGGFWPTVKVFLSEVPFLGWVIRYLFWLVELCLFAFPCLMDVSAKLELRNIGVAVMYAAVIGHLASIMHCKYFDDRSNCQFSRMDLDFVKNVAKYAVSELVWKKSQTYR